METCSCFVDKMLACREEMRRLKAGAEQRGWSIKHATDERAILERDGQCLDVLLAGHHYTPAEIVDRTLANLG